MEINRLLGDELSYELEIRGLSSEGTVAEKRSILRGLMRCERSGFSTNVRDFNLDTESELDTCENKLQQLGNDIDTFDVNNKANEYARIYSRLLHINGRLSRLENLSEDQNRDKVNLTARCMQQIDSVANLLESGTSPQIQAPPLATRDTSTGRVNREYSLLDTDNPLLPETIHNSSRAGPSGVYTDNHQRVSGPTTNPDNLIELETDRPRVTFHSTPRIISSSPGPTPTFSSSNRDNATQSARVSNNSRDVSSSRSRNLGTFRESSYSGKPIAISKWDVRFDGKSSLVNFLERIEELRVSRGATKEQLLRASAELFSGDALTWYRSFIKDKVRSWDELVVKLKSAFLPYHYERDIWDELKKRTQGDPEPVIVYIAAMENYFNRLATKPSERERVQVIRERLLPYLQMHLASQWANRPILTIDDLVESCRNFEETYLHAQNIPPPPTNYRTMLEPTLAFHSSRFTHRVASLGSGQSPVMGNSEAVVNAVRAPGEPLPQVREVVCWNCRRTGHVNRECDQPRQRYCYRCGQANVTIATCPKCSGNDRPSHRRTEM